MAEKQSLKTLLKKEQDQISSLKVTESGLGRQIDELLKEKQKVITDYKTKCS
jgi:flagellar biosynthesis/type III secretory pathway chaperone